MDDEQKLEDDWQLSVTQFHKSNQHNDGYVLSFDASKY